MFIQVIAAFGNPFFRNGVDSRYHEHVALGCFYRPKNNTFMAEVGLKDCTNLIPSVPGGEAGIAGFTLDWHIVRFVDEYTHVSYIGHDIGSVQFMTEFALETVNDNDELLLDEEDCAYQIEGPNYREYAAYPDARDRPKT
jgi:hypothetical protein